MNVMSLMFENLLKEGGVLLSVCVWNPWEHVSLGMVSNGNTRFEHLKIRKEKLINSFKTSGMKFEVIRASQARTE